MASREETENIFQHLEFLMGVVLIAIYGNWLITFIDHLDYAPIGENSMLLFTEGTMILFSMFFLYGYFVFRRGRMATITWALHLISILLVQAIEIKLNPVKASLKTWAFLAIGIFWWITIITVEDVRNRFLGIESWNSDSIEPTQDQPPKEPCDKLDTAIPENLLILEYQTLNQAVNNRGTERGIVESILIPASTIPTVEMLRNKTVLGESILICNIPVSTLLPLISLVILAVPFIIRCTTNKLDEIYQSRIRQIECILKMKGTKDIYEKIKYASWYHRRKKIMPILYSILTIVYIGASIWAIYH